MIVNEEQLTALAVQDRLPFGIVQLFGPCGSGKSRWLSGHLSSPVWINPSPGEEEERRRTGACRLSHLLGADAIWQWIVESELLWCCPSCGQMVEKGDPASLDDRLRKECSSLILIGFPFSGRREELVAKGYWRVMGESGASPLPLQDRIEADILVDRLDPSKTDPGRLSEALRQCYRAGLGTVVVRHQGRRLLFGSAYRCSRCQREGEVPGIFDLDSWGRGKKELDPRWRDYRWRGIPLETALMRSARDWLEAGGAEPPRWPAWKERMLRLEGLGLGGLSLGRTLLSLSSGERALFLLARCLEWKVSGRDLVLEHPEADLSPEDQWVIATVAEQLAVQGNRVWLESRERNLTDNNHFSVRFGGEERKPPADPDPFRIAELPAEELELGRRVEACLRLGKGELLLIQGGRGAGKSLRLISVIAELKRHRGLRKADLLDTDPWRLAPGDPQQLMECTGLWSWLSGKLIESDQARGMRLLPGHFRRQDALGRCPRCMGAVETEPRCPLCGGTGLGERVLSLSFMGEKVQDLWREPLQSLTDHLAKDLPRWLRERMQTLIRFGMGLHPGAWPLSCLSRGEITVLKQLRFIWDSPSPAALGFDEPFRGLDLGLRRELAGEILRFVRSGSMAICAVSGSWDFPENSSS